MIGGWCSSTRMVSHNMRGVPGPQQQRFSRCDWEVMCVLDSVTLPRKDTKTGLDCGLHSSLVCCKGERPPQAALIHLIRPSLSPTLMSPTPSSPDTQASYRTAITPGALPTPLSYTILLYPRGYPLHLDYARLERRFPYHPRQWVA